MSKYHISIIDLETGENIADADTDCIIGAYEDAEHATNSIAYTACDSATLTLTVIGAEKSAKRLREKYPTIKSIERIINEKPEET